MRSGLLSQGAQFRLNTVLYKASRQYSRDANNIASASWSVISYGILRRQMIWDMTLRDSLAKMICVRPGSHRLIPLQRVLCIVPSRIIYNRIKSSSPAKRPNSLWESKVIDDLLLTFHAIESV